MTPVPIGAGDIIAISGLIAKIISAIKKNSEVAQKFRELIVELELLSSALSRIQRISPARGELVHLEAIRAAVSACKIPLESFLAKLSKYERSFGCWNVDSRSFQAARRRFAYILELEGEVKDLRALLTGHKNTIQLLLQTQFQSSIVNLEGELAGIATTNSDQTLLLRTMIDSQITITASLGENRRVLEFLQRVAELRGGHYDEGQQGLYAAEIQNQGTGPKEATDLEIKNDDSGELQKSEGIDEWGFLSFFTSYLEKGFHILALIFSGTTTASAVILKTRSQDLLEHSQEVTANYGKYEKYDMYEKYERHEKYETSYAERYESWRPYHHVRSSTGFPSYQPSRERSEEFDPVRRVPWDSMIEHNHPEHTPPPPPYSALTYSERLHESIDYRTTSPRKKMDCSEVRAEYKKFRNLNRVIEEMDDSDAENSQPVWDSITCDWLSIGIIEAFLGTMFEQVDFKTERKGNTFHFQVPRKLSEREKSNLVACGGHRRWRRSREDEDEDEPEKSKTSATRFSRNPRETWLSFGEDINC